MPPPLVATRLAIGAIALAALLWAIAATVASHLFGEGVDPIELSQARAVIAAGGLALAGGIRTSARARSGGSIIGLGLSIALVNATYYVAIERLNVAVALVLQYTAPVLVVVWSALSARRAPPADVGAALIASVTGVVLVSGLLARGAGAIDALGIAMGLATAVLFATYTLLSERASRAYGPLGATFRGFFVASVFWIAYQLPRGWPETLLLREHVLGVTFVGVAGTLLPFLLFVWGVERVRAERAAIAATLEPVAGAIAAWVWLDQGLTPLQVLGATLVIAAVLALQLRGRTAAGRESPGG